MLKTSQDLFSNYKVILPTKGRRSERGDLITSFLEELNPPRSRVGLKELLPSYLSWKFSSVKMSTPEIYRFYQDCKRANNFSSYFWFKFKI